MRHRHHPGSQEGRENTVSSRLQIRKLGSHKKSADSLPCQFQETETDTTAWILLLWGGNNSHRKGYYSLCKHIYSIKFLMPINYEKE
jgi:hypothetical protein